MADFLQGVETLEQKQNPTVQEVNKSIVAVVGTAPTFLLTDENKSLNKPMPIRNYQDIAKYAGLNLSEFTLPDALTTILDESGGATMYMINVFDETKHTTAVENATVQVAAKKATIQHKYIKDLVVKNGETLGVLGTDYTFNEGLIEVKGGFDTAATLTVSYKYFDTTKVVASDIIGAVDADGICTGLSCIEQISALYGDDIGLIDVPVYSALETVRGKIEQICDSTKAYSYNDAPAGTRINSAITARQSGTLMSTSARSMISLPYHKRYNSYLDITELRPASPVLVGLRIKLDKERTIAKSITNTKTVTCKGLEYPVQFKLNKADTESNTLNSKGISTVINHKGQYYAWGARSCNFPSATGLMTFESARRTADLIEDSIEKSSFVCVGENIDETFIDGVLEMINNQFKTWGSKNNPKRIILDGKASYDSSLNPAEQLADGHIIFCYEFCPLGVAERITYYSNINIQIFKETLGG